MLNYKAAFCLRDDPFAPNKPLEKMSRKLLIGGIVTKPLRIYEEPRLIDLYCPKAGLFEFHFNEFKNLISLSGYRYSSEISEAGIKPFIFFVSGSQGTGKTTLVNRMVNHLQQCKPEDGSQWQIFPLPLYFQKSSKEQIEAISLLEEKIGQKIVSGQYCCIIIDDLIAGAESRALKIYDKFTDDNTVFLFLLTSDLELIDQYDRNYPYEIKCYRTKNLTSQNAIELVRHRVNYYRDNKLDNLRDYSLFPFDEQNLREAVESGDMAANDRDEGILTLRVLNRILHEALKARLQELPDPFNIADIPESQVNKYLLILTQEYHNLIPRYIDPRRAA